MQTLPGSVPRAPPKRGCRPAGPRDLLPVLPSGPPSRTLPARAHPAPRTRTQTLIPGGRCQQLFLMNSPSPRVTLFTWVPSLEDITRSNTLSPFYPPALPCLRGLRAVDNTSRAVRSPHSNQAPHEWQCRACLSRARAVIPWIMATLRVRSGDMLCSRPPSQKAVESGFESGPISAQSSSPLCCAWGGGRLSKGRPTCGR